jgi:2-polyprenyl-3-methyl-5-hydroxy-6-metoxy-1,4-benzoquinol methylase
LNLLEISDVIVDFDEETLQQKPVRQNDAAKRLRDQGQHRAARYVERLPAHDGILDEKTCNAILLRAHTELQRLNEEFLQADRVRRLLHPLLCALRAEKLPPPYRVVDIGCGLGYMVRALAAHGRLGRDVELIGCDMNQALISRARDLADEESLPCEFRAANAFRLQQPAHVFLSTGVVHHFRGPALDSFFAGQKQACGFIHHDMQASPLSPLGSWIFHSARMREPLARHDGVVSARRAHTARTLLQSARAQTPLRCAAVDESRSFAGVILRPMHAVVGVRGELWNAFTDRLGPLKARLSE